MSNYNVGGGAISGYLADNPAYVSGSSTVPSPRGTLPAPYDTGRYTNGASFTYTIPATNGPHRLVCWLVENAGYTTGGRKFHVDVNGQRWLTDLDIYSEVGANVALPKTIDTQAVGGFITITITPHVGNGMLAAIQIDQGLSIFEQILNELRFQTPHIQRLADELLPPPIGD